MSPTTKRKPIKKASIKQSGKKSHNVEELLKLSDLHPSNSGRPSLHIKHKVGPRRSNKMNVKFSFDVELITNLIKSSSTFRRIVESGRYVYAENRIVLYHPLNVKLGKNSNGLFITERVARNPFDYGLVFRIRGNAITNIFEPRRKGSVYSIGINLDAFYSSVNDRLEYSGKRPASGGHGDDDDNGKGSNLNHGYGFSDDPDDDRPSGWTKTDNSELEQLIKRQIKVQHTSINKLAEYLGISPATISRFWTDTESRPDLGNVIAVCLALCMSPPVSDRVIALTGYCLRDTPLERTYRTLINIYYTTGLDQCNELMKSLGFDPIPHTSKKLWGDSDRPQAY